MKYPKMIIFDYGHTLLYEPGFDSARGNAALLEHAVKNPNNCTVADVRVAADLVYNKHIMGIRAYGYDIGGQIGNRALYEYLGIEFSLTPLETETVFWDAASSGAVMPDTDKMLDYLNSVGIRTAVISNLMWSGQALKIRFDRLLPNNKFEFIMTSSDYLFRKPSEILFRIALTKAGLAAEDVWYCGDNAQNDVEGASSVGIFPVWYDNPIDKDTRDRAGERVPECEHLYIREWSEMVDLLEKMKKEI